MAGIFISYRREDTAGHAGRLFDRLVRDFPNEEVFIDAARIASGDDFAQKIETTLQKCDTCIVLIGRRWLTAADKYGQRRIDKPDDWVRAEIGSALTRNIKVIPLLVDDASLPEEEALPSDLVRLRYLQAHAVRHETFHQDVDRLVVLIREAMGARKQARARAHLRGERKTHPLDGLEYVWIPPGDFMMGRVPGDNVAAERYQVEKPRHPVQLTRGFWISRGPVSVRAYKHFRLKRALPMPRPTQNNPNWTNDDHPIVNVTWTQARDYCAWVGGRLPTEAQWEYAARGGQDGTIYPWGNDPRPDMANYRDNPQWGNRGTSPIGSFPENGFGLVDVVGNVWEWVSDWFDPEAYPLRQTNQAAADPEVFVNKMDRKVVRGGAWGSIPEEIRISVRGFQVPGADIIDFGLRCLVDEMPDE
ncbi:MAG TPA: SUMF1/EgtB/PvdO family nonheme iron enzyme [Burkholderiaceae bacterium]|nr:SUMF1/EgtB/PvdO family nonheme iron enzyme [Burkholderiaceae bacterium]